MTAGAATGDRFEASASMLGYMYQMRQALYCAVERYEYGLDWSIAIEAADDIEEVRRDGKTYYQLKHRAEATRLTDRSPDLWKTLRIWSEGVKEGRIDLDETDLLLLTTAELVEGTAGRRLQPSSSGVRDEEAAWGLLVAAARGSRSETNKKAYEAFNALLEPEQRSMLARVQVIGGVPNMDAVDALLQKKAVIAVGHNHVTPFLERVEGWLFRRVVSQLQRPDRSPITGSEFDEMFTSLQNQFRPENLPIDDDIIELKPDASGHADRAFVRQLNLFGAGNTRIALAVREYMRAFEQRSRWLQDGLLQVGELRRYERKLTEAWEYEFAAMEDELGQEAAEEKKVAAAREIYRWATSAAEYRIRHECDEEFVCRGSFHMLADEMRVGWHVDFVARLMAVLEPAGARRQ